MSVVIETRPAEVRTRQETLRTAAALIEEHGWTAGGVGVPRFAPHTQGNLCILGAVAAALGLKADENGGKSWMYDPAAEVLGVTCEDAYGWNDGLERPDGSLNQRIWPGTPEWEAAGRRVVTALDRLADGATWDEAIA